jgi:hypothetical protein
MKSSIHFVSLSIIFVMTITFFWQLVFQFPDIAST